MEQQHRAQRQPSSRSMAMKISSTRDPKFFYVNWWLTDRCSWDCSYCHDIIKRGMLPYPDLRDAEDFVAQAHRFATGRGLRLNLDITGGEVTEWPFLIDLLQYAKSLGSVIKIRTNANQSLDDFAKTVDLLDCVEIEFHPEYTQTSHFLLCLHRAAQQPGLVVAVNLNAMPDRWPEIESLDQKIREKWPQFSVKLKMLFEDPVRNTQPMQYQEPQKAKLKRQSGNIRIDYDDEHEFTDYQTLILEEKNQFKGMRCNIGLEQITVDAWGVIRRGHCRVGGSIGSIGKEIRFDPEPVICVKEQCANAFDIQATKIKSA